MNNIDPMALNQLMWPARRFYKQQRDIIYSVESSVETYVVAGNKLGVSPRSAKR